MATHSSILAWKIPWREEPSRLQSMGFQSWTRLSTYTAVHMCMCIYIFLDLQFINYYFPL